MGQQLVIIGDGLMAEIAYEYFTHDSDYDIVAFAVETSHLSKTEFHGLPVIPFENIETLYPPSQYQVFVALVYNQLNRLRTRLYHAVKGMGYTCSNYISSRAFVWKNVEIGENVFIFEDNTVQPFVKLGNNIILWSGNHIGHHTKIDDHNFISSHVVLSGNMHLKESCFIGVNACFANDLVIEKDGFFAIGSVITRNTEPGAFYVGNPAHAHPRRTAYDVMKVPEALR